MNELVQLIMQKTGLPQERAQQLVETVITHLKGRLPDAVTSHLDAFLSSASGDSGGIAEKAKSAVAGLSGLLGKSE